MTLLNMKTSQSSFSPRAARLLLTGGSLSLASLLTGCGVGGNLGQAATKVTPAVATVTGSVHGGNQPVSGATLQLYAAGIPATGSGYGVGATPLLTSTVTTDANGNFSITGKYTCPTPAQQVYLVATGGNPGLPGTVNNTGLAMMATLGTCPAGSNLLATIPNISIDEVTTVAGVFALNQFMAAPATANKFAPNIGAPTTSYATGTAAGSVQSAVIGMNNAFTTSKVLADISTGFSPNTNFQYATPESGKINTLADIIATCVNSNPATDSNCSTLFTAATPTGKTAAADTIQALYYMAQNPINNLTTLYNQIPASPPFLPTYTAPGTLNTAGTAQATNAFNDTTIAINYAPTAGSVPAVGSAFSVGIDAYGNAWVDNTAALNSSVGASVVELGVDGSAVTTPATTFTASLTAGSASQFTTAPTSGTRTITTPRAVTIDLANRAWISNYGDAAGTPTASSVAVFTGSTAAASAGAGGGVGSTGYFVGDLPYGIAADGAGNVFVSNTASPSASVLDGASISSLVSAPGSANDGTYTYSTASTTTAPYRTPGNSSILVVDTNPNVTGGILWSSSFNGCKVTTGQYGTTSTLYGVLNLFSDSTLTPLTGSDAVSSASNATVGAGSSSNCGSTSTYVGQLYPAGAANVLGLAVDRNNGLWMVDEVTSSSGFDGLTYLTAPTASTGIIPSGFNVVNGVAASTSNSVPTSGTTLSKGGVAIVDGNNNVWVSNQTAKSVVEAQLSGSTITFLTPGQGANYGTGAAYGIGFQHNTTGSTGIAVDPSGNVWVTNGGTATASTYTNQAGASIDYRNSVTVLVGAAGPVITPTALAIKAAKLGTKP